MSSLAADLVHVFAPLAIRHPRHIAGFTRLLRAHREARVRREAADARGLQVPPFLVLSVTDRCNLRCAGCFALAVGTVPALPPACHSLDASEWRRIVAQARDLGIIGFIVAGGEPFMLHGLVDLIADCADRAFVVFTNGTALQERDIDILARCSNAAIVVSLEGDAALTDARRGVGVFDRASGCLDRLGRAGVVTGVAATVTAATADYWSMPSHIADAIARTSGLAFFFEYIPTSANEHLALDDGQRKRLRRAIVEYRSEHPVCLLHSPADEELAGGCVSAGRGFAHVTPTGDVTPCPVSPASTHNLRRSTLESALSSELFVRIRADARLLETADHPCALAAHRDELEALARRLNPPAAS